MSVEIKVSGKITNALAALNGAAGDAIMRIAATTMGGEISTRIHEKGQKADSTQIGTYSPDYIKKRVKNGWGSSSKVILDFTDQMRNDFTLVTQNPVKIKNGYALGFSNEFNNAKAAWNQERYGKIYALTTTEREKLKDTIEYEVNRLLR